MWNGNGIIETIKANKGIIIKTTLIVGAAIAGVILLGKASPVKVDDDYDVELPDELEPIIDIVGTPVQD